MTATILSHSGKRDQRCTVQRKKEEGGGGGKKKKSDISSKVHKVQVGTAVIDVVEPENAA